MSALHSDKTDDVATSSNYRDVAVKCYTFFFDVSFEAREIRSSVTLSCVALKACSQVILDIHDTLRVEAASCPDLDAHVPFSTRPFAAFGTTLILTLPKVYGPGETFAVTVKFVATGGPGVVWLDPLQTAGKKLPYMYTQGQAVMNRSLFPCQDTPAVKSTFVADVKVPDGFDVLMSANKNNLDELTDQKDAEKIFHFEQTTPIPAYLVAMAVGEIKGARIGPRSMVYAEPAILERAKNEFDGVVEGFISTAERLFGDYVWGRYDILIMPPSYPFGGMENACLTFVSPCILVGDKSLTDIVIHEISHSWFGNLVTNANWGDFWLNEGFTMFAQRRIMEELYGREYMCLEASVGQALLEEQTKELGEEHHLSCLRVVISPGVDPDDTYNETPYEKGFCFVSYLQSVAGGTVAFDGFLRAYVARFKYQSIVAEDTLAFFLDYFPHLKEAQADKTPGLEFEQWLTRPGRPLYHPDLTAASALSHPAQSLADLFLQEDTAIPEGIISTWKPFQILHFLDRLLDKSPISERNMQLFIESFPQIVNSKSSEVRLRWSKITIRNNLQSHFWQITDFLHSQGKIKYSVPIYRELVKGSSEAKRLATDVFRATQAQLHCEVTKRIESVMATL